MAQSSFFKHVLKFAAALALVLPAAAVIAAVTFTIAAVPARGERALPETKQQIVLSYAPLVRQVSPAVVNIYTKRVVTRTVSPFMNDPFFERFFGQGFGLGGGLTRRDVESSLGSGMIVDEDGLVITNAHVIKGAQEISVVLDDGREFDARIVLSDAPSDLAVLRIDPKNEKLPYATLKPSESLEVGDIVLAIGNPFGVGQTVTSGIVSALARSTLNINDYNFFIQTDAAINPGNSGGPLVAMDGGVVGINTAIYSRSGGSLGIGFAIPSEMVATVLTAAREGQEDGTARITRPWIGLSGQAVTPDIAESLDLPRPSGILVVKLHEASPARTAGLEVGDVIVKINGRDVRDLAEMKFRLATVPMGKTAKLKILRKGKPKSVEMKAMPPPNDPPRNQTQLEGAHPFNGATVARINPAVAVELGLKNEDDGVAVIDISPRSRAGRILTPGDVILKVNNVDIATVKDLQKALARDSGNGAWAILIERGGRKRRIVLR